MPDEKIKIIYENDDLLVIDKPAGIIVFPEGKNGEKTLIDLLIEKYPKLKNTGSPPRHGIVHRLDKDTSGVLLIAKNNKALEFLQEQFKKREVEKKYLVLVAGNVKNDEGIIETLIGRSPKNPLKQKIYLPNEPGAMGKRETVTEYRVLKKFSFRGNKNYTLLEVIPKTGRKHQIRAHLAYLGYPVAGDKMYGFKSQPCPEGLNRQFLHSCYLKIKLPDGKTKEFKSDLPKDLKKVIENLN